VVDTEVIQYGDKEWSVKKPDARGEVMPVLVDFAHGKPMFVIHTDHHDRQAGAEETGSKSFRQSRSNVETLSQIIPKTDLFPTEDVATISMVDSADFAKNEITPETVMNYVYKFDKDISAKKNRMLLGLVTNKLLLAFKNKPNFLERLVMESSPSLLNLFIKIKEIMEEENILLDVETEENVETKKRTNKTTAVQLCDCIRLIIGEERSISFQRKHKEDKDWWHDGWFGSFEGCMKYAFDVLTKEKLFKKDHNEILDLRNSILETKREIESFLNIASPHKYLDPV
jgi:hypothetical protein